MFSARRLGNDSIRVFKGGWHRFRKVGGTVLKAVLKGTGLKAGRLAEGGVEGGGYG